MEQIRNARALGAALRAERETRGFSQQELAARAGISRETVIGLEKGKAGTLGSLFAVLAVLDTALDTSAVRADHQDLDAVYAETEEL